METSEIRKRLGVLQKMNKSQRTEEANKELTSIRNICIKTINIIFLGVIDFKVLQFFFLNNEGESEDISKDSLCFKN